jgi:hypothetical protein
MPRAPLAAAWVSVAETLSCLMTSGVTPETLFFLDQAGTELSLPQQRRTR